MVTPVLEPMGTGADSCESAFFVCCAPSPGIDFVGGSETDKGSARHMKHTVAKIIFQRWATDEISSTSTGVINSSSTNLTSYGFGTWK